MNRVLLDSNIFLHALGDDDVLRPACIEIIDRLAEGTFVGEASALLVSEIAHVRNRRSGDRRRAAQDGRVAARLLIVRAVDDVDIVAALDIFLAHAGLQMNDAVHVAVARRYGLTTILSTDRGFDDIPGLRRVDPADAAGMEALLTG